MARWGEATWDPIPGCPGLGMAGGTAKGVAHSTEGSSYAGARSAYVSRGVPPHFTIEGGQVWQHIDTALGSYAMGNSPGGVETNRGGSVVVQVELVGYAGQGFRLETLATFVRLQRWLRDTHGVALAWPAGRPPKDSRSVPPADAYTWVHQSGWFAHCQVPEQEGRWDPGFTDADWAALGADVGPSTPYTSTTESEEYVRAKQYVDPDGTVWLVHGLFRTPIGDPGLLQAMVELGLVESGPPTPVHPWTLAELPIVEGDMRRPA